ncbi:MAG: peptidase S15 [Myxococcaceae bacterium]|nr:MAG: peptidase S15 [Myxococcaceae bacterium]
MASQDHLYPSSAFDSVYGPSTPPRSIDSGVISDIKHFSAHVPVEPEPSQPDVSVYLDAYCAMPKGAGPFPVIILPSPLAPMGWRSYWMGLTYPPGPLPGVEQPETMSVEVPIIEDGAGLMPGLARAGYIAFAYSERGLADSKGLIDVAGPRDQRDGSAVIDFVLDNVPEAAPDRIAFAGASYGAGQSLLIAAHDRRVKAVAAMSAWADLAAGLFENNTRHMQAFLALRALFEREPFPPKPDKPTLPHPTYLNPETALTFEGFTSADYQAHMPELLAFAAERSPLADGIFEKLNRSDLAILLCTYWHETLFSNNKVVEFFNKLSEPAKRLIVQVGDHGAGEVTGLAGLGSRPTDAMRWWFDHHLKGLGELDGNTVVVEPMYHPLRAADKFPDWETFVRSPQRFHLRTPGREPGSMGLEPDTHAWEYAFTAGVNTEAEVAAALLKTGQQERLALPLRYQTADITSEHAVYWRSDLFPQRQRISGEVRLHLTVKPANTSVTLVAYLFDVTNGKNDRIVTSAAYTLHNEQANQPTAVDFGFQLTDYDLPPGHSLLLVVDTQDKFLADESAAGAVTVLHPANGSSYVDIPMGDYQAP